MGTASDPGLGTGSFFRMLTDIRRKLIRRLILSWCILSVLIGTIVFFLEMEKIDDSVLALAVAESRNFSSIYVRYLNSRDPSHQEVLMTTCRDHVRRSNFIIIELYNKDKEQVIGVSDPLAEPVERELNKLLGDEHLLMRDEPEYIKAHIADRLYLRTYVPIKASDHEIVGYFEGVYGVKPEALAAIRERTLFSLLQVVVVIFVTTVALYPIIIGLTRDLVRYSVDLSKANIGMLKILGSAIAKRDGVTNRHNYRVSIYAIRLAERLGLGAEEIRGIIKGAFLHDVGKIAISDAILWKPGKLDTREFEIMKTHVEHGVDIVSKYAWLKDAVDIVRSHHEKFDGTGYMTGLKGDAIPRSARIFSVADYFDALTSTRPYRETLPLEEAIRILKEIRGSHFDPDLLDAFLAIVEDLHAEISNADEERLEDTLNRLIEKYFGEK